MRGEQDDDAFEVVPGSEFVISRTAHRNNTSHYFVGERKSNFTEVTELLKGKGIIPGIKASRPAGLR